MLASAGLNPEHRAREFEWGINVGTCTQFSKKVYVIKFKKKLALIAKKKFLKKKFLFHIIDREYRAREFECGMKVGTCTQFSKKVYVTKFKKQKLAIFT